MANDVWIVVELDPVDRKVLCVCHTNQEALIMAARMRGDSPNDLIVDKMPVDTPIDDVFPHLGEVTQEEMFPSGERPMTGFEIEDLCDVDD